MKSEMARANKIAERNMKATLKVMPGSRLRQWIGFWNRKEFTPNRLKSAYKARAIR